VLDVLRYRWYIKAVNTYYDKYLGFLDGNNLIHANFNLTGTVTGRISSSKPNMQQIPRWSEEQKVKDVFIAGEGYTLLEADYSQAEIRVAAHYTKDPGVLAIFDNGLDYHAETAKKLGIPRQDAKVVNLAINYGAGAFTIAQQLRRPESEVKKILIDYHKQFPGFRKTSKEAERIADEKGYVRYWTGRRRHFNHPTAQSRTAFNSVVQGGTAEMVRRTMQRLDDELPEALQLAQVHDSIIFKIPKSELARLAPEIKRIMEDQPQFSVAMKVDMKEGERWSEMKEMAL
jgi:DNA polymerase-1